VDHVAKQLKKELAEEQPAGTPAEEEGPAE
jgi:hypothetical protein